MNANEAFKVLGMEKKFPISEEQLSKAYRAKAKEVHPDITGKDEEMKKVNEAHEWLKNNLAKVNKANTPNEANTKNESGNNLNILDIAADDFVKRYEMAFTREMKRKTIYDFLNTVDKIKLFRNVK
ncbi:DnaJ domain-containing protein [Clostridium kluyveri]|uniref:J domain-containing protein n=2 Tax=Clostridium kluyveri TaxID=1534 RepID=A5MYP4_CLOK5|nr:DnaJ domain-containing protein [Clostridium kluyveri]ABS30671.1 Hypothetical protein CKL_1880 [Clostridium kluyveri DSM 555]EDK33990.1 Conserved hypothetical protein [Clostridium kluyveri DSM 555]BAH06793.1 hypothetical protein CKR_1742 [Clostridium kluyveri NBRC 12016]